MSENEHNSAADKSLFALLIAGGRSVRHAARIANVAPSTGYRWSKSPKLQRAVQQIRADMFRRAAGQLADAATEATKVSTTWLSRPLAGPRTSPAPRANGRRFSAISGGHATQFRV